MSETQASPQPIAVLELRPLDVGALPLAVAKLVASAAPAKVMAAKGIAALRPGDLLTAIYQLSFDGDAAVKEAAQAAPGTLPGKILVPGLAEPLPGLVLHFFALKFDGARADLIETILTNAATPDETFVALAERLGERELETVFQNDARLLRCPAILQALYFNRAARMSSVNRAIELLARNGVRVDGIPAYDEIARAITEDSTALEPAVADASFGQIIADAENAVVAPDEAEVEVAPVATKKPRKSGIIDFARLKMYEKVRLAALGNEYCRQNLVRDPNRIVAMAAIRSPRITDSEIVRVAGNRSVCEDVIRYIANQRDLVKQYGVRLNLVKNPKCPLTMAMRFLPQLSIEDVRALSRSKNVPSALATAARKIVQSKAPGG